MNITAVVRRHHFADRQKHSTRTAIQWLVAIAALLLVLTAISIPHIVARATTATVVVGPGNQGATGWQTLQGIFGEPGPDTGTQTYETGPATPPLGVGSLEFRIGSNNNWSETVGYNGLNDVALGNLTELGYSTFIEQASNTVQDFFAILVIDTNGDHTVDDFLFFFPGNQLGCSDNAPPQHAIFQNQWQSWDARGGVWVSAFGLCNAQNFCGTADDPKSLADYLVCFPNARIINDDGGTPDAGDDTPGLIVGYGGDTVSANFIGNLDNVRVGVSGMTTTFDFDPCVLTISCPSNVTAVTSQSACPSASCTVVNFPAPTTPANCGATVVCTPPSGSCFAIGTTTVNCTASELMGQTASCSFTVSVFDVCLQDDSNPASALVFNSITGDYRLCCGGTIFTGRGTVIKKGCIIALDHYASDRRLTVRLDKSVFRGTASLQFPPGTLKCTITDRDIRNNSCSCPQ